MILLEKIRDYMKSILDKKCFKSFTNHFVYVIDASICGYDNLIKILEDDHLFVLTSITIRELERLQKSEDVQGFAARKILNLAADNHQKFIPVEITEEDNTPDDCIIDYCYKNKDHTILLTADKSMVLKSRMKGVKVFYLKHNTLDPLFGQKTRGICCELEYKNGKLITTAFSSPKKTRFVYSNSIEITEGAIDLSIDDSIFVATKTKKGIFFAHYLVTNISVCNNVKNVFCRRFYNIDQINNLNNAQYKAFLRPFWRSNYML